MIAFFTRNMGQITSTKSVYFQIVTSTRLSSHFEPRAQHFVERPLDVILFKSI